MPWEIISVTILIMWIAFGWTIPCGADIQKPLELRNNKSIIILLFLGGPIVWFALTFDWLLAKLK